jgi:pimeloyl-ACP methyl ester carboxylesterase
LPLTLHYEKTGQGPALIILHGLFGCLDNWRAQAGTLAEHFTVYRIDQRNHGRSPHSEDFRYRVLAEDLLHFMDRQGLRRAHILGHSMGGKTAMQFAAWHANRIERLIIEDIAPYSYPPLHAALLTALTALPVADLTSRSEADRRLAADIPERAIRGFILKNLVPGPCGGMQWRFNLTSLARNYPLLIAASDINAPITVPTLFLRGANSAYLRPERFADIKALFPGARLRTVPDAGHWLHSDNPARFVAEVRSFLLHGKPLG